MKWTDSKAEEMMQSFLLIPTSRKAFMSPAKLRLAQQWSLSARPHVPHMWVLKPCSALPLPPLIVPISDNGSEAISQPPYLLLVWHVTRGGTLMLHYCQRWEYFRCIVEFMLSNGEFHFALTASLPGPDAVLLLASLASLFSEEKQQIRRLTCLV